MSEQTRPQPPREIDRADVLGELEHRFRSVTDDLPVIGRVLDELVELDILRYRERADDPSADPVGTVRQSPRGTVAIRDHANDWVSLKAVVFLGSDVVDWPVIGAVPGTPAAEAEKPERDADEVSRLPIPVRQRVGQLLLNGDVIPAARTVQETLRLGSLQDGVNFVHGLDEYRTYLNHRQVEDVSLPPLHADNEAIVRGEYAETVRQPVPLSEIFPPRVFKADYETNTVQEPPESVSVVVDKHGDHLRRKDDGWIGDGGDGYPKWVKPWERHALPKYAPYREVV